MEMSETARERELRVKYITYLQREGIFHSCRGGWRKYQLYKIAMPTYIDLFVAELSLRFCFCFFTVHVHPRGACVCCVTHLNIFIVRPRLLFFPFSEKKNNNIESRQDL